MKSQAVTLIFLLLSELFLAGCNDNLVPLQPAYFPNLGYITVDAEFCTSPPDPGLQKIKYLFVLDHSASNQPGFPLTPGDVSSTDPNGDRRYGPLVQFVDSIIQSGGSASNQTSFSLIDFNDTAYQPAGISGFMSDAPTFLQAVQTDWIGTGTAAAPVPADKGFTNYQAALQLAQQLILADAESEAALPTTPITMVSYHVVFVSDGVPIVASGSGTYTQTFAADIQPVINQLLAIKTNPVTGPHISVLELDTAYYYQTTQLPAAEALLQQMATAGNGQYFQFGNGADIAYENFAPPNRSIQYVLDDVWVDNLNAQWWDNGQLLYDSGGSGMPDQARIPLGAVAGQDDSDGNGVSDLVEYRTKGTVCNAAGCNPAGRDLYAICDGLSPQAGAGGSVTFPDSSGSGFNDCEAFVLGASLSSFSTNGTFVPDFLAFKNLLPILAGTDNTQLDPFGDGITNYQKLKQGLPITVSQTTLSGFLTRQTSLLHEISASAASQGTNCYELVVQNVAVINDSNTIRVSYVQNAAVLDDKPVIKTAQKTVNGQSSPITFSPGDFN